MKTNLLMSYLITGLICLAGAVAVNAEENQGIIRISDKSVANAGVVKIQAMNQPVIRGQSPEGCGKTDDCCPTGDGCGDNCGSDGNGCGAGQSGCGHSSVDCREGKSCHCGPGQCGKNGCPCSKHGSRGCDNPNCDCPKSGLAIRRDMRRAGRMGDASDWAADHGMRYCDPNGNGYGMGYGRNGGMRGWYHCQSEMFLCRNHQTSLAIHDWMTCKFGYFIPTGGCGKGLPPFGHYSMVYAVDPQYSDPRDAQVYASQKYGVPVSVPLPPNVHHQYNYSWGVPGSRLTPVSNYAY